MGAAGEQYSAPSDGMTARSGRILHPGGRQVGGKEQYTAPMQGQGRDIEQYSAHLLPEMIFSGATSRRSAATVSSLRLDSSLPPASTMVGALTMG